jgi:hypothetical protein
VQITGDATFKWRGATLLLEGHYRRGKRDYGNATALDDLGNPVAAPREPARDGYGWHAEADVLLGDLPLDVTVAYGQVRGTGDSGLADVDELGGGLGWFVSGRAFRVQSDYFRIYESGGIAEGDNRFRTSARLGF